MPGKTHFKRFRPATCAALGLAALAAACAPVEDTASSQLAAGEEGGRECFYPRNVTGFRNAPEGPDGSSRIYVDVRASDTFLFELFSPCRELTFARSIAFDTISGVGRVCSGLEVDLLVPDPNLGTQRCQVKMIRKLEPGEEGARAGAK
ncbi:DUF6491 family protein [Erythrobacter sp.]|uniref:DUF6491 family protein n=1 Tax=Erythrobacter sp. TaxID=1042 RepID=UPI001425FA07|nr:DUF6491 family protein [Erythrobacter sp.]QIQ85300.1 MAG: hypothetical protein G9473_00355 [Erythrobacter sp.]